MLGILADMMHRATFTERRHETHEERRNRMRAEEFRRDERDALDREIRFRRGYW
ncbi:MAG: hypothetical protein KDK11_04265 [Maritimibacter sp.]|nr:hypothetical protein [Maritimibacter sp.]MCB1347878.1 hypothetical protein [Maritimibacter sp.]